MKKTFKVLSVLVVAALTLNIAGCGKKADTDSSGIKTVTVWSGNSHSKAYYEKVVNDYNNGEGKKKGIRIDYQVKDGGTITQSLEVALQSGEAPDMFGAGDIAKLVENDNIIAIEDLAGGKEFLEKYQGKLYPYSNTYKGKTYRVPITASPQGLLYNKDMFKEAGLVDEKGEPTPPESFEKLVEYAKILTNKEKKQYGIILPMKWGGWFGSDILSPMMSSCGHEGYNPVTNEFDYMPLVPIMQAFLDIKADGSAFPGAETLDNDTARAQFAAGNIGMKFGYSFDVGVLNDQFPAECDWGVAPYPVVDVNNKYKQRMDYGGSFYINKSSVDTVGEEKLIEVLKFFTGDTLIKQKYEDGIDLPYDWSIVEKTKLNVERAGWEDFAKLVDFSSRYPQAPNTDMGSAPSLSELFISEVWSGKTTPKELCERYTKISNEAREKYYSIHTDEDTNEWANSSWNIKR